MLIINFAHPLTDEQRRRVEELAGQAIVEVRPVICQFDDQSPFAEQATRCVDEVGLSPEAWQGEPLLINPPGYAPAAAALIAELHGRMGHFPTIIRIRPVVGSTPTTYEVAELLNLEQIRNHARASRFQRDS